MAINTTTRQTTAFTSGNNFAFGFKVYEEGDVKVIRITTSTGAEEVLTITTHYTVTLNDDQNANPGGTVILVSSGNPVNLGSGFNVVITSKVQPLQQTEITNQGGFFPEVINDVLDKAAILDQQQQAILDKTIRFPLTQTVGGIEITENAANRANKTLVFDGSGDLSVSATVDGRDVSADGAKLDTIETNAKDDQTAAEIRALVESANDSNVFTDADHTKLNAIEVGATGDQDASEIRTLVESANDSNVFTDNDHTKLNNIEDNATRDQTASEIKTLLQSDKLTASELANNSVTVSQIQDSQITAAKLNPATVITASEQASATPNDTSFLTSAAADARFFNISSGDTIKDGDTFPDNDTTIATTAAINDRIIDLVDDVGGFVPIANETSFPTANPDINNANNKKGGTIVSVKEASTNLVPSGTTVTIANGRGSGLPVIITGVPSTIPQGFGFLVETTSTDHTYAFHRLSPKATEVTTVAGKAVEIGRLGTADAVADMNLLGTTDVVADMNMLATTDIIADMALLATTDVIADMALLAVTDVISDMNDLATSANITAMANCSNNISSINNASSNLNSINNFGNTYQVAANDPTTDGGGNTLAEGDLYFNTSANRLKVYDGSSWVNGVEISGSGAVTTGNTFTGDNRYNDGVKALFGTGSDLQIYHDGSNSYISETGTGALIIDAPNTIFQDGKKVVLGTDSDVQIYHDNSHGYIKNSTGNFRIDSDALRLRSLTNSETYIKADYNGAVELYFDNSKKLETISNGVMVNGKLGINGVASPSYDLHSYVASGSNRGVFQTAGTSGNDYASVSVLAGSNYVQQFVYGNGFGYLNGSASSSMTYGNIANAVTSFMTNNATRWIIYANGHFMPNTDSTFDIGSNSIRVRNGYFDTLYGDGSNLTGINTDLVADTSPQLGGDLDTNGHHILLDDDHNIKLGNDTDFEIFHENQNNRNVINSHRLLELYSNGNTSIRTNNGDMMVHCVKNAQVELYYDDSKKLETYANGLKYHGHQIGQVNGSYFQWQGANSNAFAAGMTSGADSPTGSDNHLQFHHWNNTSWSKVFYIHRDFINIPDNKKIGFGNSNDLTIEHDVSNSRIRNITGQLQIRSDVIALENNDGSNFASITGLRLLDNAKARFGSSNDLIIYHESNNSYILSDLFYINNLANSENIAKFANNAGVTLFYDNVNNFETISTGFKSIATGARRCTIGSTNASGVMLVLDGDSDGDGSGNDYAYIQHDTSGRLRIENYKSQSIKFGTAGVDRWDIQSDGHIVPQANGSYDIGTSSYRIRNIYTNDLNLSNEGGANDVDGTWGSYTIQEGAEDLFLINKRNGKKYKFALMEVS